MSRIDYFSSEKMREDLRGKTVRGGAFTAVAQVIHIVIHLASIPILSRLLTPSDFGLVAMVTIFTGFAGMFVDAGLSMATVQREDITHRQVSNLFWLATAMGLLLALLVVALSPLIAGLYQEPRLVYITIALAGSFILSGLTIQHQALLRRAMQFKALAVIQIASAIISQGIAVFIAWRFQSYWALVVLPITLALVRLVGSWIACSWHPGRPSRGSNVRPLIVFGANLTGFNFTNYLARNSDNLLIGWYWGASPLGFYERAYKLLMFPLQLINAPLSNIAIPTLSRLNNQPERYRSVYLRFLELVQTTAVPLVAFLWVTRDWCIDLVLGPQWAEAAPIFGWLAVAALVQPLGNTTGWLFISQGRGRDLFQWGIFSAIATVVSFLIGLPWGPAGVAAAYALVGLLVRSPLLIYWISRKGPIKVSDFIQSFYLPVILSLAVVASLQLTKFIFPALGVTYSTLLYPTIAAVSWLSVLCTTTRGRVVLASYRKIAEQLLRRRQSSESDSGQHV